MINVITMIYKSIFIKIFYDRVIMLIWYKMMYNFSYGHNRSKITALHPIIIGEIYMEPTYVNLVIKNNKIITLAV